MIRTDIFFYLLLGHLLLVGICSSCSPAVCAPCNISAGCCQSHHNTSDQCTNGFRVSINSTGSKAKDGDKVILTCVHNFSHQNLTFEWFKNEKEMEGENKNTLVLEKVFSPKSCQYVCSVNSSSCLCWSSPETVTVQNDALVLLVVCGVSALVLVVVMGLAMKFKLKRDNAKHKERMRQRAQAQQSDGPSPVTPRGL